MVVAPDDGGVNCTYLVTWDWYQDCYYPSPESTTPTYCDPVVVYNVDYILLSCPPPSGGGGGPSPEPDPDPECLGVLLLETGECIIEVPSQTDPLDSILKDTCLNNIQMSTLRSMFSSYLEGDGNTELACLRKKQFDLMKDLGVKFGFCIKDIAGAVQAYNPKKDIFYFSTEVSLNYSNIFDHEFFHSYQNKYLSNGSANFAPVKNESTGITTYPDGFINIEFETALYRDITNIGAQSAFYNNAVPISVITAYESWLDTITINNTKYPTSFTDFGGQYFYFMNLFKQYSGYADRGNIISTMTPSTLLNLFSTSNCK